MFGRAVNIIGHAVRPHPRANRRSLLRERLAEGRRRFPRRCFRRGGGSWSAEASSGLCRGSPERLDADHVFLQLSALPPAGRGSAARLLRQCGQQAFCSCVRSKGLFPYPCHTKSAVPLFKERLRVGIGHHEGHCVSKEDVQLRSQGSCPSAPGSIAAAHHARARALLLSYRP